MLLWVEKILPLKLSDQFKPHLKNVFFENGEVFLNLWKSLGNVVVAEQL